MRAMSILDPSVERAAKDFLARAAQHHQCSQAFLFGSYARGDYNPSSDVDIALVLADDTKPVFTWARELAGIAYDVLLDTGVLIQPIPIRLDDWNHPEQHPNPALIATIQREGRPL